MPGSSYATHARRPRRLRAAARALRPPRSSGSGARSPTPTSIPTATLFVIGSDAAPALTSEEIDTLTRLRRRRRARSCSAVSTPILRVRDRRRVDLDVDRRHRRSTRRSHPSSATSTAVQSDGVRAYDAAGADVTVARPRTRPWRSCASTRVGRGRGLAPRRRVAAREPAASATPTTPRSGSRCPAPPTARSCSPKACTATAKRRGLAAIPTAWKVALAVLAVALCVFAWSRGRRLGPPDQPNAELPPPRAAVRRRARRVTLERTHEPARRARAVDDSGRATASRSAADSARRIDADELDRAATRPRVRRRRDRGTAAPAARPTSDVLALGTRARRACNTTGRPGERAARPRRARGPQGRRRPGPRRRRPARGDERRRPPAARRRARRRQDAARERVRARRSASSSGACSSRPTCCRPTSPAR